MRGLGEVDIEVFATMRHVLVITSTYGEGEMPDNAQLFWQAISASTAPRLEQCTLRYWLSAIPATTGSARRVNLCMRLEQLGAKRVYDRIDCDIDYEEPSNEWIAACMPQFAASAEAAAQRWKARQKLRSSREVTRTILTRPPCNNKRLSGENSGKDIRHFEFDLTDSGLKYEAGDALGVIS